MSVLLIQCEPSIHPAGSSRKPLCTTHDCHTHTHTQSGACVEGVDSALDLNNDYPTPSEKWVSGSHTYTHTCAIDTAHTGGVLGHIWVVVCKKSNLHCIDSSVGSTPMQSKHFHIARHALSRSLNLRVEQTIKAIAAY